MFCGRAVLIYLVMVLVNLSEEFESPVESDDVGDGGVGVAGGVGVWNHKKKKNNNYYSYKI